ncbi:tyrosine-type recombinase/integrase [Fodinicurvata fenggangensis]|uniref:tyrosine-type recombinase/integrase n=1 Tax=Fodinicurvata fenggangensis TaxID=1121830 RepID=UPI00047D677A|nr:tyrosine-type recombinase/integrase [Fodinicurvata fenggangensis]
MPEQVIKTPRKRPTSRLASLPISSWPDTLQQRFQSSAQIMGWGDSYKTRVAGALGKLFQLMCSQNGKDTWFSGPPTWQSWKAYIATLEKHYSATTALTYRELAAHGLCALYQDEILQDIIDDNRMERQRLTRKPYKPKSYSSAENRKSLKIGDWPESWQKNWHKAFETKTCSSLRGLLEQDETAVQGNGKPPREWSIAYRNRVARGLGLLAGWMKSRHVTEVTQAGIQDCIAEFAHQAPKSVLTYLQEIHRGLLILELHPDPEWLADEIMWLKRRAHPRSRQEKLLPLGQLRAGAMAHLEKMERLPVSRQTASRYRDALILALLTYRPDRVADFHTLALGETVQVNEESAQLYVMQAKTHQGKSSDWPTELQVPLQRYLDVYRPILSWGHTEDALWLSGKTGSPLSQSRLASVVTQLTNAIFGKSLSPHFIRNVYATSFAEENPDRLPDVSMMLGHRDERSIDAYTTHACSVGAGRALEIALESL